MKHYFVLATLLLSMVSIHAQRIETQKTFGGYVFSQEGKALTLKKMSALMESDQELSKLVKSAKGNTGMATALSLVGGALVGFPVGQAIGGGDPNWVLAGVGAGLIAVAIPISSSANKKLKTAVEGYNTKLAPATTTFDPQLRLQAGPSGLGVALQF